MADPGPPTPPADRPRVLIVDDSDDGGAALAVLLGLHGFHTRVAKSGREALAAVPAFRPNLMVTDLSLPDEDGCRVVRRVRAGAAPPAVVVLTGYDDPARRRAAAEAGASEYLVKAGDSAALVAAVRRLCGTAAG